MSRPLLLDVTRRLGLVLGIPGEHGTVLVPHNAVMRRALLTKGHWGDRGALSRAVQLLAARGYDMRGRTFVDLGANLGTTSLAALRLEGFGRAVACEPDPENARFLRATTALNGLEQKLVVLEAAISDQPGTAHFEPGTLRGKDRKDGTGSLSPARSASSVEVEVVSVDSLVERGVFEPAEVGLLWLDLQGHEGFALAGAGRLLDARVPVVTAVRSGRLISSGGRELFVEQVAARYATLVNLRGEDWREVEEPVGRALDRLLQKGNRGTDVLLLP